METIAPHNTKEWLNNRGISDAILDAFDIGWTSEHVIIPVFDPEGKKIFHKYRRSPFSEAGPKYRYDKGATSALYGAHKIPPERGKLVIVCEGELDALALWSHGFIAVSSTGGAGTFDPRWAELLQGNRVVICYDNDPAGYNGALNTQEALPEAGIALLPERSGTVKDVTDFLMYLKNAGKRTSELTEIFDVAITYPMQEFEVPKKVGEQKKLKKLYEQRIIFAYDVRNNRTRKYQPTHLVDLYIQRQQDLIKGIQAAARRAKYKVSEGRERSLEAARRVDMRNFLKFDRQGFAVCPFHNEKTPSLHYIVKSNKAYCFGGCQKSYDVIDVVRAQRNIDFSEAVEQLCKGI